MYNITIQNNARAFFSSLQLNEKDFFLPPLPSFHHFFAFWKGRTSFFNSIFFCFLLCLFFCFFLSFFLFSSLSFCLFLSFSFICLFSLCVSVSLSLSLSLCILCTGYLPRVVLVLQQYFTIRHSSPVFLSTAKYRVPENLWQGLYQDYKAKHFSKSYTLKSRWGTLYPPPPPSVIVIFIYIKRNSTNA